MADLITITRKQWENDVREAKAEGWSEGYDAGLTYMTDPDVHAEEPDNPYEDQ